MIPLRDENPSYSVPLITIGIVLLNAVIFLFQISLSPEVLMLLYQGAGAIPARFSSTFEPPMEAQFMPTWATAFSSMFLHGGFLHLVGNMWFLWLFGDNVEDRIGKIRFVIFYLLCGVAALTVQVLTSPGSNVPIIGASGAIAGVLGAYLALYPRAMIRTLVWLLFFVQVIRVPAVLFLGIWFLLQFVQGVGGGITAAEGGGVAWFAHLGGFVAGVILIRPFTIGRPFPPRNKHISWDGFGRPGRPKDDIF